MKRFYFRVSPLALGKVLMALLDDGNVDEVEVGYYHTKNKRYYTIDGQPIDVIRWQEIVFPKESE